MTVVLIDPHYLLVPMEALEVLRQQVQYTEEIPAALTRLLPAAPCAPEATPPCCCPPIQHILRLRHGWSPVTG